MTTPRGIRDNNPGNVRLASTPWVGELRPSVDNSFCTFVDMAHGVRCLAKLLLGYERKGLHTVRAIINRWAPPVENNTSAYVSAIASACGVKPDDAFPLTREHLLKMAWAICHHENGGDYVSDADMIAGVTMALS